MNDFLKNLKMDDIPEEQRELAELVGLCGFIQLIETYGGTLIYIPKLDNITRNSRNEEIRNNFNGYNYRELARKYDLTEVSIRCIVSDIDKEMKAKPPEGQMSFFEENK